MDEADIYADEIAVRYYQALLSDGGCSGRMPDADGIGRVMACPGKRGDVVHVQLRGRPDAVAEARWLCQQCDPWIQVAADIACRLATGRSCDAWQTFRLPDVEALLGGTSDDVRSHAGAAVLTLQKAAIDLRIKCALSLTGGSSVSDETALSEFYASAGANSLRTVVSQAVQECPVRIPRIKLQEWSVGGTVRDLSEYVQSRTENTAIAVIRSNRLGFPRAMNL